MSHQHPATIWPLSLPLLSPHTLPSSTQQMTACKPPTIRILGAQDVEAVLASLDIETLLDSQTQVFRALSAPPQVSDGAAAMQMPMRTQILSPETRFLFMPARLAGAGGTAAKVLGRPLLSGEPMSAFTLVMDEATGRLRGVVNSTQMTAVRNACGSVLSLRAVRPDAAPRHLVVFGSGAQAQAHAKLFLQAYPSIDQCSIIVRRITARATGLLECLADSFPAVHVSLLERGGTLAQMLTTADVIVTATASPEPLFSWASVRPGAHVILVGSAAPQIREVDVDTVRGAAVLLVDSADSCLQEAGELIAAGTKVEDMTELGSVLGDDGERLRASLGDADVTIFKSVGLGLQDVTIAHVVLEAAMERGIGTEVPNFF